MKLKVLAIGTGVLVVLAAMAMVLDWQRNTVERSGREGQPLLPAMDMTKAARIDIDGDKEHQVTLLTRPDGTWVVEQQSDYAANAEQLSRLLVQMNEAKLHRRVTDDPEALRDLGVLTPKENDGAYEDGVTGTRITIRDDGGETLFDVILGNNRKGSGGPTSFGGQYVRYPDESTAYLVGEAVFVETKPREWIEKVVFDVPADDTLQTIRIAPPGQQPFAFTRKAAGEPWAWQGKGPGPLDQEEVKRVANQIAALDIARVADADADAAGLGRKTTGEVQVDFFDGRHFTLSIGKDQGPEEFRYITLAAALGEDAKGEELRGKVEAFNARFGQHVFGLHAWDAGQLQRPAEKFMVGGDK